MKTSNPRIVFNRLPPKINGRRVRHEFAPAGILNENLAKFAVDGEIAKHITAGAVEKMRDASEDFALRAFAATGRAEQENRAIHHLASLCFNCTSLISVKGIMTSSLALPLVTCRCKSFPEMLVTRVPWYSPRAALMTMTKSFSVSRRTTPKKGANFVSKKRRLK